MSGKTGILLVNLGTPDAPTPEAVKRYLKQFLSDRRVVEIPPIIWQPILRGIVLTTRPKKSAEAYAQIWTDKGSPLAFFTAAQAEALAKRLPKADIRYAMRYGNPSMEMQLQAMRADGCERLLVAPLYPQYSGATTGTVEDELARALKAIGWTPELRTLPPYYAANEYVEAIQDSLDKALANLDFMPDAIVISFHGMPERTRLRGDPYHDQCQETASLLSQVLGSELIVSFQSRFGRAKWLGPATDVVLEELGAAGRKVAIFAPGFSVDCLETLEELAIRGREQFEEAGGKDFAYLPCLNDSDVGMDMLQSLVEREISDWL